MQKLLSALGFLVRHFIASLVSILFPIVLIVITYVILFVVAIIIDSGLGSPIALPLWIIIGILISFLYTTFLLFPSVLLAEVVSGFCGKWHHVVQIPLSILVLFLFILIWRSILENLSINEPLLLVVCFDHPIYFLIVLSIPLGLYWWAMKIAQAASSVPKFLYRKIRNLDGISVEIASETR